jgi:hypothetical protein
MKPQQALYDDYESYERALTSEGRLEQEKSPLFASSERDLFQLMLLRPRDGFTT